LRKQWCHDHRPWTLDNLKCACDIVRWVVLHAVPYIRKSLHLMNTQGSLVPTVEHRGGSLIVWAAISWDSFCPNLSFMAELLQGSMWTGWVIKCIPYISKVLEKRKPKGPTVVLSMAAPQPPSC
jgi:hypothetical protein